MPADLLIAVPGSGARAPSGRKVPSRIQTPVCSAIVYDTACRNRSLRWIQMYRGAWRMSYGSASRLPRCPAWIRSPKTPLGLVLHVISRRT